MSLADELAIGLSTFVSIGNRADVSANDVLQYLEADSGTDVVLLYLESFGNPRKFARIARAVSATTPIVAVKGGRSVAGAAATASHTGALVAASDATIDALFRQAGIIRTDTLEQLLDVGTLLAHFPLPAGPRVAVIANAGGLGVLAVDACDDAGLVAPELSAALRARLAELRPQAATRNPIDTLPGADAQVLERFVRLVADSGEVDAIVGVWVLPGRRSARPGDPARRARVGGPRRAAGRARARRRLLRRARHRRLRGPGTGHPRPRPSLVAARLATDRPGPRPDPGGHRHRRAAADHRAGRGCGRRLAAHARRRRPAALLRHTDARPARSWPPPTRPRPPPTSSAGPVALKALGPTLLHKSDAGAVALDLPGGAAVRAAAEQMLAHLTSLGTAGRGPARAAMAPHGVELIAGMIHDPTFGPVLACGAGGTLTELVHDVAIRLTPLTDLDAARMLRELRTFPLLDGYRGASPVRRLGSRAGAAAAEPPGRRPPADRRDRRQPPHRDPATVPWSSTRGSASPRQDKPVSGNRAGAPRSGPSPPRDPRRRPNTAESAALRPRTAAAGSSQRERPPCAVGGRQRPSQIRSLKRAVAK